MLTVVEDVKEKRELMEYEVEMRPMLNKVMRSNMLNRQVAMRGKAHFFSMAGEITSLEVFLGDDRFMVFLVPPAGKGNCIYSTLIFNSYNCFGGGVQIDSLTYPCQLDGRN